jgi:hypothetical protein
MSAFHIAGRHPILSEKHNPPDKIGGAGPLHRSTQGRILVQRQISQWAKTTILADN